MFWRFAWVFIFFLCVSRATAHDPFVLDARRAAPGGIQLELTEWPSAKVSNAMSYRLRAVGLPRQIIFALFTKDFSHSFHELASGFQLDGSGNIVSIESREGDQSRRLDEMLLKPGPYPRGAVWEVGLVSADRAFRAFAKVIPHPINAREGTCTISIELISQRGDRFIASGSGFIPEDDVMTESRYSGRVIQKRKRISPDGLLPPDVISHGARGADRSARYSIKGRSCDVAVDYDWGEPALVRR
jgi:hypothetical protein